MKSAKSFSSIFCLRNGLAVFLFLSVLSMALMAQSEAGGTSAAGQRGSLVATYLGASLSFSPSTSFNFGQIAANTTASQTVTLSNPGNTALTGLTLGTLSAPYSYVSTCGATLSSLGGSCTVTITFAPTATGTFSGSLQITSAAGVNYVALNGSGTGTTTPVASVSPSSLSFGPQPINTVSLAQTVNYSNTGNATLTLSSVSISGPFAISANQSNCGTPPFTVDPGVSCQFPVSYGPTAVSGSDSGSLSFTDNGGSPSVSLTGGGGTSSGSAASLGGTPQGRYLKFQTTSAELVGSGTGISYSQMVVPSPNPCALGSTCATQSFTPGAGDAIVVAVTGVGSSITSLTVTDSQANSYACTTMQNAGGYKSVVCYAFNVSASSNVVTAHIFGQTAQAYVYAFDYSGLSAVDQTTGTQTSSGTSITSATVTTTAANELLFKYCVSSLNQTVSNNDTGYTTRTSAGRILGADQIVSSTGSYSGSCKVTGSTALSVILATFSGGGSASGPNAAYSSISELNALDANGAAYSRAGWTVTADASDTSFPLANATDGNNGTFWQSPNNSTQGTPPQPHNILVDMGSVQSVSGITALVRQDGCANGWPVGYKVFLDDANPPTTQVASGSFSYSGQTVACPGATQPPAFTVSFSQSSGKFGSVNVGSASAPQTFYLSSTGSSALNISSVTPSITAFSQTNDCGSSVPIGTVCNITVTFNPAVADCSSSNSPCTLTAVLSVNDDASNTPQTILLTGTAINQAKTLQTVTVSPSTAAIVVGSTINYSATCNYSDGSNASCTASWTSSNTSVATVSPSSGASTTATAVAAGASTITATVSGVAGTAALTVNTATSGTDLLPNVCAASDNSGPIDCTSGATVSIPTGWTFMQAESFEGCTSGSSTCNGPNAAQIIYSTVGTSLVHHGSKSVCCYAWAKTGTTPNTNEIYVSWWEHLNANTHTPFEEWVAAVYSNDRLMNMPIDWFIPSCAGCGSGGIAGAKDGQLVLEPEGCQSGGTCYTNAFYAGDYLQGYDGTWHHWEWDLIMGTTNTANGSSKIWRDGTLLLNQSGKNYAGFETWASYEIRVGGTNMMEPTVQGGGACPSSPPIAQCATSWQSIGTECLRSFCSTAGGCAWGTGPNWSGTVTGSSNAALNGTSYCTSGGGFPNPTPQRTLDDIVILYR